MRAPLQLKFTTLLAALICLVALSDALPQRSGLLSRAKKTIQRTKALLPLPHGAAIQAPAGAPAAPLTTFCSKYRQACVDAAMNGRKTGEVKI